MKTEDFVPGPSSSSMVISVPFATKLRWIWDPWNGQPTTGSFLAEDPKGFVINLPRALQTRIETYGGCSKFFLLSQTAILSQKKNYFSQTFAISTKTLFAGPYVGLYLGIFVRKQKLDKGNLPVWATIKNSFCGGCAFTVWRFAFIGGPCSPSRASSDTPTPKLRAHLLPASLETRHNKSTV